MMTCYYRDDMTGPARDGPGRPPALRDRGIGPADIQTAVLYDAFTPFVLFTIEEFGFCGRGEAKDFVADGNIEIGGRCRSTPTAASSARPTCTGERHRRAVRLVRGTSVNQVPDVEHVVVTAGTGVPTSGMILGRDR